MIHRLLPASAVSLLALVGVLACAIFQIGKRCGADNNLSKFWSSGGYLGTTAQASGAFATAAVRDEGVGRQDRILRDWGNANGGGVGGVGVGGNGGVGVGGDDCGEDCDDYPQERRARLAFLIMSSGDDVQKLEILLPAINHPDNVYLIHVDAKTPHDQVERIRSLVEREFSSVNGKPSNGRMLEPAGIVSWGGFSITLTCLYGIAAALLWDPGWDYFINLSTSDFPIMTQNEMMLFLGAHADSAMSFMEGSPMIGFERRWEGYTEDQGMQRNAPSHTAIAMKTLGSIQRPYPQRFRLYKGEFWVILHRSFCEYTAWSPDNIARSLAGYFTGFRISDESYFQTLACHAEGQDFPIHGDNFRFASWNEHHKDSQGRRVNAKGGILIHPESLDLTSFNRVKSSGALFARKFDYPRSKQIYMAMEEELRDEQRAKARVENTRARFQLRASDELGRKDFCGDPTALTRRGLLDEESSRE